MTYRNIDNLNLYLIDGKDIHNYTLPDDVLRFTEFAAGYFSPYGISSERCGTIISKTQEVLGEYNFMFEWFTKPTTEQLHSLIEQIDAAMSSVGCRYTLKTT